MGRIAHVAGYALTALVFTGLGLLLARTEAGSQFRQVAKAAVAQAGSAVAGAVDADMRMRMIMEHPEILRRLSEGGGFGGLPDPDVARNMFGRDETRAIEAARDKTVVEAVAPRTWLIRMPIVNAVLFETDAGLVLVDTGMAPAGPAIAEALREVSDAPLHTVIYTHGHVDHAYGTWALLEAGHRPEVVAHEALVDRFERYIRLRGSLAHYMSQPLSQLPEGREDLVWPTQTFSERLELEIGGEKFVLVHHPAETDDQLYVWVPGRRALASADYYQGFLPNAGNGKRVQRYVEEWARALREMAGLGAELLLPAHGAAQSDADEIRESLLVHAEALEYVVDHTLAGLNAGLRKDRIFQTLELPPHLAGHPLLNVQYVTPKDISKMVLKRYTGWWDDIPSHWTPAPLEREARELVELAGGVDRVLARSRELIEHDIQLACHLTDWAWLAYPGDPRVQQLVIDTYLARIEHPDSNTQEILAYLDAIIAARSAQLARDAG